MDRHNRTKALVESGILTSVAAVLILMSIYLPVFFVGFFVWPMPITLIYIKYGYKYSLISLIIVYFITAITYDPLMALALIFTYGLLGFVMGYAVKNKKSPGVSIGLMSLALFLATVALLNLISLIIGHNIISQAMDMVDKTYDNLKETYVRMGISKDVADKAIASLPDKEIMKMELPYAFITSSIVISFVYYLLTEKIIKRFKYNIPKMPPISQWYLPSNISFGIIIIFVSSFIIMNLGKANGSAYFINASLIFNFVFTIIAIAFVSWTLKKAKISIVLRWIITILLLISPIGGYLYFVGIFDYVFDYRRLDNSRRKPVK